MSYCRMGDDSDIYVIRSFGGNLQCMHRHGKNFPLAEEFEMSLPELVQHLTLHIKCGDKVPYRIWKRIHKELGVVT